MGLFSRMKDGIASKANAALDKAIDPEKEVEMAIMELEEQRTAALQELISYKATARQMDDEIKKQQDRAATWEKRAMVAVKAGDDEAARTALREKKNCLIEVEKIKRDRDEAAGYAVQLNRSRKEFETKLQILKLKKGTLATQLAAARAPPGGDAFGNDSSVWDKFKAAEERIDDDVIATEVDAAMRGETAAEAELDAKILGAGTAAGVASGGAGTDAALAAIKAQVATDRAAKQKALAAAQAKALDAGKGEGGDQGKGGGT